MIQYNTVINGIEVHAQYTEENVQNIFLPLLGRLTALQRKKKGRVLAMLAAPPGTGKSTLASFLQELAGQEADIAPLTVIGMDGFHRYQEELLSGTTIRDGVELPLVQIKGAPITFALERLTERVRRVAAGEECGWPEYSRLLHNPIENAITVRGDIVLLEGNYLLLDREGWRELAAYADYTIRIEADEELLKKRLVERKIKSGASLDAALRFVEFSDLANVRECLGHTGRADLALRLCEDGSYCVSSAGDGCP